MLKWIGAFDPSDVKDYTANWTEEMDAREDTIATANFSVESDTGLSVVSSGIDATEKKAIMWISASNLQTVTALAGQTVSVAHTITTTGGRTLNKTVGLKIKEL